MIVICHHPKVRKDASFPLSGIHLRAEVFNVLRTGHHTPVSRQKGILKRLDHLVALDALFLFVKFYEGDEIVRHDLLIVQVWRRKRVGRGNPLLESIKSCSVPGAIGPLPPRIKRKYRAAAPRSCD